MLLCSLLLLLLRLLMVLVMVRELRVRVLLMLQVMLLLMLLRRLLVDTVVLTLEISAQYDRLLLRKVLGLLQQA